MNLARELYVASRTLPKEEMFGLTSQLRRAAVSIPANIAEGCARNAPKEYLHFLGVAAGSQAELSTLLFLARDLYGLPSADRLIEENERVGSMLWKLKAALRKKIGSEGTGRR